MNVLLGVTGSVAAILTPKLVQALLRDVPGMSLKVIATERALYFFDRSAVGLPVQTDKDEWLEGGYVKGVNIPHIDLGDWADLLVIAPLTADTLSDMAHGKTDKFLTSTVLAWPIGKHLILAPAMNTRMWQNPLTQENLATVSKVYGARVVGPVVGHLACNTHGIGAMAQINSIVSTVLEYA